LHFCHVLLLLLYVYQVGLLLSLHDHAVTLQLVELVIQNVLLKAFSGLYQSAAIVLNGMSPKFVSIKTSLALEERRCV
jgi:hypothetical protein